nr:GGDEF domain-containing protein [Amycolatopsis alba]
MDGRLGDARRRLGAWHLWSLPRPVRSYVLVVNLIAVLSTAATAWLVPVTGTDLIRFGVLTLCAAIAIEGTRQIERQREYDRAPSVAYVDTKAVWSVAAVIALPPVLAAAMVVVTYTIAWLRIWPHQRPVLPHRWIFSAATVLCGTQAAVVVLSVGMRHYPGSPDSGLLAGLGDLAVIIVAAALRWAINTVLVMIAIALSSPPKSIGELFSGFGDQILEAGALGLGLVTAVVLVQANPLVLVGVVIALVALHRGLLLTQYRRDAHTDATTGLVTKRRWRQLAEEHLGRTRAGRKLGVLFLDLDNFKTINDTYGHPNGDLVLRAVGDALRAEIREQDVCGRWGGEEFAIVIPDIHGEETLRQVAERIRHQVAVVSVVLPDRDAVLTDLTVSIGGALYPAANITSVDDLLVATDTALYRAKQGGRNRVELAPPSQ